MTLRDTWANGEQFNASDMNELIDTTLAAYVKPSGGVPKTDMASAVQTSLGKADSAVQSVSSTSITDSTTTGRSLLTTTDASTARTALGVSYGTTSGTVAQGNDSRFTPASTSISDSTATGRALLTTTDASTARTTLGVAYGTSSGTVAQGNDSRITGAEQTANKNANNGYCGLDSSGLVSASQLPSYVDDVLEYANLAAFPGSGTTGKIFVAVDTGKVYRWSGSVYVEISPSPGSTDSVTEGSTNLYFTNARADARISAASGLLPVGGISATGTASSSTYLRGDGAWQTVTGGISRSVSTITTPTTLGNTASTDYVTFLNYDTSSDASYSSVKLLLPGNGANNSTSVLDYSSAASTVTVGGNAKISTSQSKFGGSSVGFAADGTDFLSVPHSTGFNLAGDFTVEAWVYITSNASAYNYFISKGTGSTGRSWAIYAGPSNISFYYTTNGATDAFVTRSATLPTATWMHIAVVRSGSTLKIFKDGTQQGADETLSATFHVSSSSPLFLGRFMDYTGIGHSLNGFLDDVRVTSTARYTSNFTAPTTQFVSVGTPTLPTAASNTNLYTVKNISGVPLNVGTTSSQQIDGAGSYALTNGSTARLISDGSNWRTV